MGNTCNLFLMEGGGEQWEGIGSNIMNWAKEWEREKEEGGGIRPATTRTCSVNSLKPWSSDLEEICS